MFCSIGGVCGLAAWGLLVLTISMAAAAGRPERVVRIVRLDGTTTMGAWRGSADGRAIRLAGPEGETTAPCDDIASAALLRDVDESPAKSSPTSPRENDPIGQSGATGSQGGILFHLADGGRLSGEIISAAGDAVVARTSLGESVTFAWDKLAGIRFASAGAFRRADEIYREALTHRLPSQDVLISRDAVEVKKLEGRLESLDRAGGAFVFGGESRTFQIDKIYGIVFAAGAKKAVTYPVTIELWDGSVFSGTLLRADAETMQAATSIGVTVELPMDRVAELRFSSDRVVPVSDLKASGEQTEGIVHAPWPVARDRCVSGGPLSIHRRTFERGLGMHSLTRMSFSINGEFERLAATIGMDDAVRPLGSVVMRVEGDGRVLFDSGEVRGTDPPRDMVVDVSGVKSLALVVDYGEGLDVSDQADWGDVRLIRPRGSAKGPPTVKP